MCPPRVPEHGNKTLGWRKVYEASIQWQKSTNNPSQPASLSLAPLSLRLPPRHPTGRWGFSGEHDTARLQVTDMSHHLKPCGTIIPLSLWRQKGRGGGGSVVGNGGSRGEKGDGGYRARVSEWEEKWRVCGLGGAGGCFTPGLFKETAQGMPLVLLTKHFFFSFFFFLEYCWVCSSRILWAPSLPPQPFEDASESFSRRYRACFSADVSNEYCNAAAAMQRGYLGSKDRCRFNVKLAAEGLSLYSCCAAQRWQPASAALKSFHKIVLILDEFFLWLKLS